MELDQQRIDRLRAALAMELTGADPMNLRWAAGEAAVDRHKGALALGHSVLGGVLAGSDVPESLKIPKHLYEELKRARSGRHAAALPPPLLRVFECRTGERDRTDTAMDCIGRRGGPAALFQWHRRGKAKQYRSRFGRHPGGTRPRFRRTKVGTVPDVPAHRAMVDRGLQYLLSIQKEGAVGEQRPKAVTSLFVLACLSSGVTPSHPQYGAGYGPPINGWPRAVPRRCWGGTRSPTATTPSRP